MLQFSIKHIGFFAGSLVFSFLINSIMLRFVKTLGIRDDKATTIRWTEDVKPSVGGLTFYIIFLLSITLHPFIFSYTSETIDFKFTGIIGATSLGFLMGLSDDAYNTRPLLKLITQILCGLILIYSGTHVSIFEQDWLNFGITLLWVVGLMNSINMLDNMDGITTIVSLVIGLTVLILMLNNSEITSISMTVLLGLVASLICFLYFNWSPARMYMGDTGSQYLGILLAAISINYLWNPITTQEFALSRQLLIPLLSFIIPITDTTIVVIKRVGKGSSPFIGGKDHTTHHLSYLGFSEKQVARIIAIISVLSSVLVIYVVSSVKIWTHLYSAIFIGYFLLIFGSLLIISLLNTDKE